VTTPNDVRLGNVIQVGEVMGTVRSKKLDTKTQNFEFGTTEGLLRVPIGAQVEVYR
jgi:hypothetical protein